MILAHVVVRSDAWTDEKKKRYGQERIRETERLHATENGFSVIPHEVKDSQ